MQHPETYQPKHRATGAAAEGDPTVQYAGRHNRRAWAPSDVQRVLDNIDTALAPQALAGERKRQGSRRFVLDRLVRAQA
ncbi:hypothetical protein QWY28_17170 [Nocardioides sp. SOB77]|uniref:Transposase n=1 Tax=Nocardioides oceani TaxID=3058369 RepID=A0ABT8FJ46_9ACTN|nr:hypothetical protein [Nocardioides oceani]MDN4174696.1 hypothetical protein [Nocardioides oceani]